MNIYTNESHEQLLENVFLFKISILKYTTAHAFRICKFSLYGKEIIMRLD